MTGTGNWLAGEETRTSSRLTRWNGSHSYVLMLSSVVPVATSAGYGVGGTRTLPFAPSASIPVRAACPPQYLLSRQSHQFPPSRRSHQFPPSRRSRQSRRSPGAAGPTSLGRPGSREATRTGGTAARHSRGLPRRGYGRVLRRPETPMAACDGSGAPSMRRSAAWRGPPRVLQPHPLGRRA